MTIGHLCIFLENCLFEFFAHFWIVLFAFPHYWSIKHLQNARHITVLTLITHEAGAGFLRNPGHTTMGYGPGKLGSQVHVCNFWALLSHEEPHSHQFSLLILCQALDSQFLCATWVVTWGQKEFYELKSRQPRSRNTATAPTLEATLNATNVGNMGLPLPTMARHSSSRAICSSQCPCIPCKAFHWESTRWHRQKTFKTWEQSLRG